MSKSQEHTRSMSHSKAQFVVGFLFIAVLMASALFFAISARSGHADPNLPNVPPHRHWINGVQVGPDICDHPNDPGIQRAFNEFHNNLHIATQYAIGPAAPGLHNGLGAEIRPTPCSVTTPPQ
jgi:hypothetical protein